MAKHMMKTLVILAAALTNLTSIVPAATIDASTAAQLTAALAKATPGTTVQLAAGTYACTPRIPAGVTLCGTGYEKTILDVGAADVGLTLAGNRATAAKLTVASRGGTAILARGVEKVGLSGVLVRRGAVGIRIQEADGARIENCIVDGSLTGIALDRVKRAEIVNNTLTHTDSVGIALAGVSESAVFNNLVAHAGVAIGISQPGTNLSVDHNLYLALFTGKFNDELARISLGPWRDVSGGLDAQSVSLAVVFRDAAKGDYQPVSMLDWNPAIPTTAGWGVQELGGIQAPVEDIAGEKRPASPSVGAREGAGQATVTPDGTFTIQKSEGTKSAGVFTRDGTLVRYLFRDLPLAKGTYGFVLPSRSEQGAAIAPGDYELRLVESNLRWSYRMLTANNGVGTRLDESDRDGLGRVAFGGDNCLILAGGWNERAENIRAKDLTSGKALWTVPGMAETLGLCRGGDGLIYVLQKSKPNPVVIRLDNKGHLQAWPTGRLKLPVAIANANGLAELDGILYVTSKDGEVYRLPVATGKLELAFKTAGPFGPVADRQRKLLWMICGGQGFMGGAVTAFTPTGEMKYTVKQVVNPLGVAVRGDRLAVADYDAGKVRYFDIRNPVTPVARQVIGRGDGPYGPVAADRFWFQKGPYTSARGVIMDLDDAGRLALLDSGSRPIVFAADGTNLYMGNAQFGNFPTIARFAGEENVARFFDPGARVSWIVDARNGSWRPEAYWGRPERVGNTIGFFKYRGSVYGVVTYTTPAAKQKRSGFLVLRYDNYVGKIVAFYCSGKGGLVVVRDENGDGAITAADGPGTPVLKTDGKQVGMDAMVRFTRMEPYNHNSIRAGTGQIWIFKGVDSKGYPLYEFPAGRAFAVNAKALVSPYTFKSGPAVGSESVTADDGELIATMITRDSPHGMGLSNSGGIDVARFRKDGTLRWYLPMNDFGPVQGVKQVTPGFILTSWGHQAEWIGLDDDGLSLGHLGFPREAHWSGYWVDHPEQHVLFQGNDGKLHVLVGDYFLNGDHWLSLRNYDNYRKAAYPFAVVAARAAVLAGQAPQTTFMQASSEKPRVTVKKLRQPLVIDGGLEKWRRIGLAPQIVITPATARRGITSAKQCSAVVRLAYEGKSLYVQVLRFCEVPTFHQTIATGTNLQDTVEMAINGFFPDGFQFSIGKFSSDGDQIVRRRFFVKMQLTLPAEVAPRVVKVLENAAAVEERRLVEAATGEDLAQAKVIVTEFKLPIDARTWAGSEKTLFPVESGKGCWLGFTIDDNDVPGADLQRTEVWPASFNTFAPKEDSAWVVFE